MGGAWEDNTKNNLKIGELCSFHSQQQQITMYTETSGSFKRGEFFQQLNYWHREKSKHNCRYHNSLYSIGARGSVVVKVLCYKPEGRGFDTR
jgi:hypothetical protein